MFVLILGLSTWGAVTRVPLLAQQSASATLHGVITDPSGALIPGAVVQLQGPGGAQRITADSTGHYTFPKVSPGKYSLVVTANGFNAGQQQNVEITHDTVLDVQLTIAAETQTVSVQDETNRVSAEVDENGGALVLNQKQLAVLSDDPDELSQQLQAMAGPGAGPNGGQIYIDGFTGGQMPPKTSIREVRINSNPFSPEYDRPGFGRIEIFTKPGSDNLHGQVFFQFNNQDLNSRSPLLAQSTLPPYKQNFFGVNLGGPLKKSKASWGFDFERRDITENAFILATTLDASLNPQTVNQALLTPQTRTSFAPRLDYSISTNNTLTARYQNTRIGLDNQGAGDFSLASTTYNQTVSENTLQLTESVILSPDLLTQTRFQFMRSSTLDSKAGTDPAIMVQGAFTGGGATVGNSGTTTNQLELSNNWTYTYGTHTIKWGGRGREAYLNDTSVNNFNGTFTFYGGQGPELDADNQAIAGTSVELTALEVYQRTLLFEQKGLSAAQIRALGGGASLYTISAGTPTTSVSQFDIGLFVNDDWKVRPNLTLSCGLRYEAQTNVGDFGDWSPRLGIAWGIDGGGNKQAKTVLRAGFGTFYDRIADTATLAALRYNGLTQQSYLVVNPDFYPSIPTLALLATSEQPQQLQLLYRGIQAPRLYQASIGIDRQINKYARVSVNYIPSRGVHLLVSRDINAPIDGVYPFGDHTVRTLTESTGFSRTSQVFISPNISYKKLFLFGFYALSYGKDDNEGQPADPYNLRAEWGPSTFADVRHRAVVGTSLPLLWKFSIGPFFAASSGVPYNITTGRDVYGDGVITARPALLTGVTAADCLGSDLIYESEFGCFDLNPGAGMPTIGRNYGRGPVNVNLSLRLARTWSFGRKGESGIANSGGPPPGGGGVRGGGGPPPGGGGPPGGGPPPGLFGSSGMRYNLTLSIMAMNALNHPNYGAPDGDLSSPYFGEYRSLAAGFGPPGTGASTYNRKISVQLRFTF